MRCPYVVTRKETTQTKMEYDENGSQTFFQELKVDKGEFLICEEDNCGAWQDGKCCYAATNN